MIEINEHPLSGLAARGLLALTLTLVCVGCGDTRAAPGVADPGIALGLDGQVEDAGVDLILGDGLPVDLGTPVPSNFHSTRIHSVCPPKAITEGNAFKLKVRYRTWCLGAAPSTLCVVKIKSGNVIELGLYLQKHSVGCDGSGMGDFDTTCDLPELPAGSYTLTDKQCPSASQKLDVAGAAVGQPTCVDTSC
jgi:hypothetical protein